VPTTVSSSLQTTIATPLDAAIKAIQQVPNNLAEWKTIIAAYDEANRQRLSALRQQFPVAVEQETIAGVNTYRLIPTAIAPGNQQRLLVHFHGGGYALAAGELGIGEGVLAAYHGQISVISVDYRQSPDHPFPAGLEDAIAVWQAVIQSYRPSNIGLLGTSAGGGLVLATVLKLRELALPLPAAIAPLSPWVDLTKTSDSLWVNEFVDRTAISYDGIVAGMAKLYAGEENLKNPLISPVYGDFQHCPPTLLVAGTRDLLLSDTARMQRQLRRSGVTVELQLFEGLSHAEYLYEFDTPESAAVFGEVRLFFDRYLGQC
jgi:acetyl esterase/lipase